MYSVTSYTHLFFSTGKSAIQYRTQTKLITWNVCGTSIKHRQCSDRSISRNKFGWMNYLHFLITVGQFSYLLSVYLCIDSSVRRGWRANIAVRCWRQWNIHVVGRKALERYNVRGNPIFSFILAIYYIDGHLDCNRTCGNVRISVTLQSLHLSCKIILFRNYWFIPSIAKTVLGVLLHTLSVIKHFYIASLTHRWIYIVCEKPD